MSTINRRIKVKFRNAEPEITTYKKQDSILKCIRSSSNFNPDHDLDPDRGVNALKTTTTTVQTVLKQCSKYETNRDKMHLTPSINWHYQQRNRTNCNMLLGVLFTLLLYLNCLTEAILVQDQDGVGGPGSALNNTGYRNGAIIKATNVTTGLMGSSSSSSSSSVAAAASSGYLDKLDNLERSVAAVLIKVAYGTTSTTKRSIPDNSYVLGLTTVATPLLTTLRYQSAHQPQHNAGRHRTYELDLERDHALPTSAPNADILKSNNNPTYPNPNRHHSSSSHERERERERERDRERQRHTMLQYNSTPMPSIPNLLKKSNGQPTIPMYPGDIPSYSPPSRSFFTPPLPPEYQNPFADKPTLRGTNNEGIISNTVAFNNRRPIPPPSLMPGHERIPFRPPDLAASIGNTAETGISTNSGLNDTYLENKKPVERKKALNTPSRNEATTMEASERDTSNNNGNNEQKLSMEASNKEANKRQEVLPNIRRILGSNGKKGDIPAVLLRQVTQKPNNYAQAPAAPIVAVATQVNDSGNNNAAGNTGSANNNNNNNNNNAESSSPNINKSRQQLEAATNNNLSSTTTTASSSTTTTPAAAAAAIGEAAATSFTSSVKPNLPPNVERTGGNILNVSHVTWTWAWNIHIYLSVVLFTILAVYSLYKLVTFNKLTHLFAQSYFVYIHLILIAICVMRIIYLCVDAYNIHSTFPIFAGELLLNLPATLLTVAFAVLILFLFLKSLNHKNNRYSALVRPLTVVVGCGVHLGLCITLHYVESYTLHNHHMYFQQQQQQQFLRRQQQLQLQQLQQQHLHLQLQQQQQQQLPAANPAPPPRVLSLICQIIYIFICLSLGLLYLYLYRILKRILKSKSQNYIHGYQNLSYAIHITIASALLFVLLATLQIFGAICISTTRPLILNQASDLDWLQWGYQFSLRLIEIAIITLISWVTGLKTSVGNNPGNNPGGVALNGDVRATNNLGLSEREKHNQQQHPAQHPQHPQHSNVANFFLPCTSSSSQEQFDTDYPAVCNANTNLHTYTMRTGKLIYDDSYALNSLTTTGATTAGAAATNPIPAGIIADYQLQPEPMYQRPYDTGSMRNHSHNQEYNSARYHHHHHQLRPAVTAYLGSDYLTDGTVDHYENPNFDLRATATTTTTTTLQKLASSGSASASASASNSGSGSGSGSNSGSSQQQMLLLQSDSCYSEPLHEPNAGYEFNNFERPVFKEERAVENAGVVTGTVHKLQKCRKPELEPERRSSNSTTNSCGSTSTAGLRYPGYNSYERGGNHYNNGGVRKSGTLSNIVNGSTTAQTTAATTAPTTANRGLRLNGAQTLAHAERTHYYQQRRQQNPANFINRVDYELNNTERDQTVLVNKQQQLHLQQQQQQYNNQRNSEAEDEEVEEEEEEEDGAEDGEAEDEEEEDDDLMIGGCNVECTNLINSSEHFDNNCSLTNNVCHMQNKQKLAKFQQQTEQTAPSALQQRVAATAGGAASSNAKGVAANAKGASNAKGAASSVAKGASSNAKAVANAKGASLSAKGAVAAIADIHSKKQQQQLQNRNALTQICSNNINGIDC